MADAVERSLQDERHLIVEAGTGTGKTVAYLVPVRYISLPNLPTYRYSKLQLYSSAVKAVRRQAGE